MIRLTPKALLISLIISLSVFWAGCINTHTVSDSELTALRLADTNANSAIGLCDSLLDAASDSSMIARLGTIRAFARYRAGFDDTADQYLDSSAIIRLRAMGPVGLPFLTRGLFTFGQFRLNSNHYQSAMNNVSESAYRSLYQDRDTFIAARAYESLGIIYRRLKIRTTAHNLFLKASILFDSIDDRYNTDLNKLRFAVLSGDFYDETLRLRANIILDSIEHNNNDNPEYLIDLDFHYKAIKPRTIYHKYNQAINDGHKILASTRCSRHDSLWAYAHMSKSMIRSGNHTMGKLYLDSALRFESIISRKGTDGYVSLSAIEMELLDSTSNNESIRKLSSLVDQYMLESDSLFSLQQLMYGAQFKPQFTVDFPSDRQNVWWSSLMALIAITTIATAIILYRKRHKSLLREQEIMNEKFNEIHNQANNLRKDLEAAMNTAYELNLRVENHKANTETVAIELKRQKSISARKDFILRSLNIELAETRKLLESSSPENQDSTPDYEAIIKLKIIIINSLIRQISATSMSASNTSTKNDRHSGFDITAELEKEMSYRIAYWSRESKDIKALLQPLNYKILLMLICGYDMNAICLATNLKRSTAYNRKELIIDTLQAQDKPQYNHLINLLKQ